MGTIYSTYSLLYFSKSAKAKDSSDKNICCDPIIIMVGCVKEITVRTLQITQKYSEIFITRISSECWQPTLRQTSNDLALTRWASESSQLHLKLVN